jgi:hypothetical protein
MSTYYAFFFFFGNEGLGRVLGYGIMNETARYGRKPAWRRQA